MRDIMACEDYDCVHIHLASEINFLPLLAAKKAGRVPVAHVHFSSAGEGIRKYAFALLKGVFRGIPSHRFACGEDAGKWFWGNDDFVVITNCVDIERFSFKSESRLRLREALGIDGNTLAVGYIGRFEPVKNPLFTLQIIRTCKEMYPQKKIRLIAVGTGSLEGEFARLTEELNLDDCVTTLGYRSDVGEILSALDVFLMPSLHEGVSLASVEAQTSGLACLFSDSIPVENQILNNSVFLPLDARMWADHIANKEPAQREDGSAQMSKTKYNITISAKELLKSYEQIGAKWESLHEI
jgi:glycosyltransferase involved in cell wall biosynthesis